MERRSHKVGRFHYYLSIAVLSILLVTSTSSFGNEPIIENDTTTTKIGLTLSGGGAKGLAHVGVLYIIDSLGIKVDYISATSMGSVVGGMYASGYNARELEEIALNLDWQSMFARRSELGYSHPRRRESYGKYIVQLPIENWEFIIPSGAIEGQQLWNTLGQLFFHVRNIEDFSRLPIPFACVATDVSTGEAVVMKEGDLVRAIRASMAIPTVFTTVNRRDKKLIDGGVVKNFPVSVARDMGADKVIGVNVAQGLRSADELKTPLDIIYQMGFYLDAQNFAQDRQLTNIYIEPDLKNFTAASFQDVKQIIESGKEAARLQIDNLLQLKAESADVGGHEKTYTQLREINRFVVDTIEIRGLKNVRPWFVRNAISVEKGDTLSLQNINSVINRLFATNYFNLITYNFISGNDKKHGKLVFNFEENPFGSFGTAIHYSSFTGVGLIGNLSTNKFFFFNTGAYLKALIGEKPAIKGGLDLFTNDRQDTWFNIEGLAQYIVFPVYEDFENTAEYKQSYVRTEASFLRLTGANSYFSLGTAWYYQSLSPTISNDFSVRGHTQSNELFFRWKHNSLNRLAFPQSGTRVNLGTTFFFNQKPSLKFQNPQGNLDSDLREAGIEINNYLQIALKWESYFSLNPRLTSFNQLQAGYNFLYNQSFINMFNIGGTYPFLKNQITFAGLNEYEVISKAILAGTMGWQYNVWDEFLISPLVNAAVYDFQFDQLYELSYDNLLLGGGLSIGYLSALGPMEITFAYSPQNKKLLAYINLGWTF